MDTNISLGPVSSTNSALTSASPPLPAAADEDTLRDLLRLLGGDPGSLTTLPNVPVAVRRLAEGAPLVHEGAPLHSLYVVRCGSLKSVTMREDGYEQVTALAMPGDVLGFDGLYAGRHATTDVALELSVVYALPLTSLQVLKAQCPALDGVWQRALSRQLARAVATADTLSAVASEVRLARFLLWLSARVSELGWSARRLRLSLCRRDLASLLGIAHETVSRSFGALADAGLLQVDNREIDLLDLDGLRVRARSTRRPVEASSIVIPRDALKASPRPSPPWPGRSYQLASG